MTPELRAQVLAKVLGVEAAERRGCEDGEHRAIGDNHSWMCGEVLWRYRINDRWTLLPPSDNDYRCALEDALLAKKHTITMYGCGDGHVHVKIDGREPGEERMITRDSGTTDALTLAAARAMNLEVPE